MLAAVYRPLPVQALGRRRAAGRAGAHPRCRLPPGTAWPGPGPAFPEFLLSTRAAGFFGAGDLLRAATRFVAVCLGVPSPEARRARVATMVVVCGCLRVATVTSRGYVSRLRVGGVMRDARVLARSYGVVLPSARCRNAAWHRTITARAPVSSPRSA